MARRLATGGGSKSQGADRLCGNKGADLRVFEQELSRFPSSVLRAEQCHAVTCPQKSADSTLQLWRSLSPSMLKNRITLLH